MLAAGKVQFQESNISGNIVLADRRQYSWWMNSLHTSFLCNRGPCIHRISQSLVSPVHRFLNQAMKMFDATEVVPINFVFFTASAIVAGLSSNQTVALIALFCFQGWNKWCFAFFLLLSTNPTENCPTATDATSFQVISSPSSVELDQRRCFTYQVWTLAFGVSRSEQNTRCCLFFPPFCSDIPLSRWRHLSQRELNPHRVRSFESLTVSANLLLYYLYHYCSLCLCLHILYNTQLTAWTANCWCIISMRRRYKNTGWISCFIFEEKNNYFGRVSTRHKDRELSADKVKIQRLDRP